MAHLTIPKYNKGYDINFTVQDADETAYNLTGYTITFKVWKAGAPETSILSGGCNIDSATDGTCHYTLTATDFTSRADYKFELQLTKSGVIESTQNYDLKIEEASS
jgi:hypothetical protein